MQLESLKMFVDVVETGSFSRAAQLNHVTQSAVSQQIRALETRYEQRLLSRSARISPSTSAKRARISLHPRNNRSPAGVGVTCRALRERSRCS